MASASPTLLEYKPSGHRKRRPARIALELTLAFLMASLISLVMLNQLTTHLSTSVLNGSGDEVLQAWEVAWGGHALKTDPGHFFDSNTFWPEHESLAFSDALIGYAPAGMVGDGSHSALVRYNLLLLFSYALAFLGAYVLARELGLDPVAAAVAGMAFAYAPTRITHTPHLQILSTGGVGLALAAMLRGLRLKSGGWVFLGWLVAIWQVSLGYAIGLQFTYLFFALWAFASLVWFIRGRAERPRRFWIGLATGSVLFLAWFGFQAKPYLDNSARHPESQRTLNDVRFYSPPPRAFFSAPTNSYAWSEITKPIRASMGDVEERISLFPGLTIAVLALIGLVFSPWSRAVRLLLAFIVVMSALLSMGLSWPGGDLLYGTLYRLPGWKAVRSPGSFKVLTSLALALLAAGAAQVAIARLRTRLTSTRFDPPGTTDSASRLRLVGPIAIVGLVVVVMLAMGLEGYSRNRPVMVPTNETVSFGDEGQPQLHLPSGPFVDAYWMFWSTDSFPKLANGYSGFVPTRLAKLQQDVATFPDAGSVAALKGYGVKTVVLHTEWANNSVWAGAAAKPTDGLLLTVERRPGVVIYHLR